ncbi:hypothetical protein [Rhizobium sp. L245/93]|uniref:hypothetical protein n=1 Tax=Rhizobium sp. L245/93 TaxID=2819998 RepID=UPI001ADC5E50|nr:hypothetical protein [Rhizobium sp. L245/93]MBO9168353.1 hypothetical protein [Rhizobium sp. L245/93]
MIVTMPSGEKIELDGKRVQRVMPATPAIDPPGSNTRIEWATKDFCVEMPETVATEVNEERALNTTKVQLPLAQLNLPDGIPFWFSGEDAQGPEHLPDGFGGGEIQSQISMGKVVINVSNTPQEVQAVIKATKGTVLPIRGNTTLKLNVKNLD